MCFLNKFIAEFGLNNYAVNCIEQAKIETIEAMNYRVETESTFYTSTKNSWHEESIRNASPKMDPGFD